jgi:hypothetical protein
VVQNDFFRKKTKTQKATKLTRVVLLLFGFNGVEIFFYKFYMLSKSACQQTARAPAKFSAPYKSYQIYKKLKINAL